jgi:hypothetical protein
MQETAPNSKLQRPKTGQVFSARANSVAAKKNPEKATIFDAFTVRRQSQLPTSPTTRVKSALNNGICAKKPNWDQLFSAEKPVQLANNNQE